MYVPSQYETSYPIAPETAFQLRLICDEETAVAANPVGLEGGMQLLGVVALTQEVNPETHDALFCV